MAKERGGFNIADFSFLLTLRSTATMPAVPFVFSQRQPLVYETKGIVARKYDIPIVSKLLSLISP
ncbi:hypothetical protein PAXRUDRAFT_821155 [Paxillus rubicundulus Ve08.2h10]|uniref:Uncharacterized protein n=1 Tax=Paxillus rubicundulus Ve08.2h10 TaxID=930991 RepID=A0A0D0EB58_9AGAM|nr:hypothetical protein PAXRUDRAFT_821155 [Paxillus rubicundulus Ve08.2h10]